MRAGLLSDSQVIQLLDERFVCSWVVHDEISDPSWSGLPIAHVLDKEHEYPFDFMFFAPDGSFLGKLTSFRHLRGAHPDVAHPDRGGPDHKTVLLETIDRLIGPATSPSGSVDDASN